MEWTIVTSDDIRRRDSVADESDLPVTFGSARGQAEAPDNYVDRVVKWLPAEVVAFWLAIDTFVRSSTTAPDQLSLRRMMLFVALIAGTVATPVWMRRVRAIKKWDQLAISTAAFPLWVFASGGPFATWDWYDTTGQTIAGFSLILFAFAATTYQPSLWLKNPGKDEVLSSRATPK
jgi:hypothetical protein